MRKIPTLFERDWNGDRSRVIDKVNEAAAWVFDKSVLSVPTRKLDGTCVLIKDGIAYKRYEVKPGKPQPLTFIPADDVDPETGKQPGWFPVSVVDPADKYHREALGTIPADGTYELVGPKVQGGIEGYKKHELVLHGSIFLNLPVIRDFETLRAYLTEHPDIEGIVWHATDGRMAKLKGRDFGIKREPHA